MRRRLRLVLVATGLAAAFATPAAAHAALRSHVAEARAFGAPVGASTSRSGSATTFRIRARHPSAPRGRRLVRGDDHVAPVLVPGANLYRPVGRVGIVR
jgi:hypothetical protein